MQLLPLKLVRSAHSELMTTILASSCYLQQAQCIWPQFPSSPTHESKHWHRQLRTKHCIHKRWTHHLNYVPFVLFTYLLSSEKKQFINNKIGYLYHIKLTLKEKYAKSIPIFLFCLNSCMGLPSPPSDDMVVLNKSKIFSGKAQITCRFLHLHVFFIISKMALFPFFLVHLFHNEQRKLANELYKNKLAM